MFGWEFPPFNSGGLGVACQGLSRALVSHDAQIIFVLPKKLPVSQEQIKFLFAGIERLKVADTALSGYLGPESYRHLRDCIPGGVYGDDLFAEVIRYAQLVPDLIAGESFEVIHALDWLSFLAGIEAKRISGKPLIVHVHATSFDHSGGEGADGRIYAIEKKGFERADAIVAVSHFTKRMIVERYGISPDKIHVVHNGVEGSLGEAQDSKKPILAFKRPGEKLILFLGRLTLQKGPDYFLTAAQKMLIHYPRARFVIAGSGDMEWSLMRQAIALGIANRVHFTGFVRGEELSALYRGADLYVMPSVSEPFGIAALEALRYNTPVIVSKQSGVSEVLTHALRVDFWDTDELANKMIAVLQNPALASQLRREGRYQALAQTWEKAASLCLALYRTLTKGNVY